MLRGNIIDTSEGANYQVENNFLKDFLTELCLFSDNAKTFISENQKHPNDNILDNVLVES